MDPDSTIFGIPIRNPDDRALVLFGPYTKHRVATIYLSLGRVDIPLDADPVSGLPNTDAELNVIKKRIWSRKFRKKRTRIRILPKTFIGVKVATFY